MLNQLQTLLSGKTCFAYRYFFGKAEYLLLQQQYDIGRTDTLQQAIRLLEQMNGFAISEKLKTVKIKLKDVVPVSNQQPAILFGGPEWFESMDNLQEVYEAIHNEQVIGFKYQPFTAPEPLDVTLHPLCVATIQLPMVLLGFDHHKKEIRLYPIDRVKNRPKDSKKIDF